MNADDVSILVSHSGNPAWLREWEAAEADRVRRTERRERRREANEVEAMYGVVAGGEG